MSKKSAEKRVRGPNKKVVRALEDFRQRQEKERLASLPPKLIKFEVRRAEYAVEYVEDHKIVITEGEGGDFFAMFSKDNCIVAFFSRVESVRKVVEESPIA